jgi:preprotein translocase subunit SecG
VNGDGGGINNVIVNKLLGGFSLQNILVICVLIIVTLFIIIIALFVYFQKKSNNVEKKPKPTWLFLKNFLEA